MHFLLRNCSCSEIAIQYFESKRFLLALLKFLLFFDRNLSGIEFQHFTPRCFNVCCELDYLNMGSKRLLRIELLVLKGCELLIYLNKVLNGIGIELFLNVCINLARLS